MSHSVNYGQSTESDEVYRLRLENARLQSLIANERELLVDFFRALQASLLECRNRLAAHDGCSRYQIGDNCIIERADKQLSRLSAIGGAK